MPPVFIGLDPTAGRRPTTYAVLDERRRLVDHGQGDRDHILQVITSYPHAMLAIDAPQSPNLGLMADPDRRRQYGLAPDTNTWADFKVCEYEMRRHGLKLYNTPREAVPAWIRFGFELYAAFREAGFVLYQPGLDAPRQFFETYPHACYAVLLGHLPYKKNILEGRLQRQMLLYDEGVEVADPMDAVEEITRHHLLEGSLLLSGLFDHDKLDALVAAYTAVLAAQSPNRITQVGDATEGQIVIPVAADKFLEMYR